MTIDDVVKLIESCKNAGVSRLKFEKLDLQFFDTEKNPPEAPARATTPQDQDHREKQADALREEALAYLNEIAEQNLLIEDPRAFEQQLERAHHAEQRDPAAGDVSKEPR